MRFMIIDQFLRGVHWYFFKRKMCKGIIVTKKINHKFYSVVEIVKDDGGKNKILRKYNTFATLRKSTNKITKCEPWEKYKLEFWAQESYINDLNKLTTNIKFKIMITNNGIVTKNPFVEYKLDL